MVRVWEANGGPRYYTDPEEDGVLTPYFGASPPSSTITATLEGGFRRTFRVGGWEEYLSDGRLLKTADRTGRVTSLTYESLGLTSRLAEITSPEGRRLKLEYDYTGLKRLVGAEGLIAEYSYIHVGGAGLRPLLSEVRYADGTGYRFTYNTAASQLLTVSDLAGVVLTAILTTGRRRPPAS